MSTADHIVLQKVSETFKLFIQYINHGQIKAVDVKSQAVLQNVVALSHRIYTALAFTVSFGSGNMSEHGFEMVDNSGASDETSTEENQQGTHPLCSSTVEADLVKSSKIKYPPNDIASPRQRADESGENPVMKQTSCSNVTLGTQLKESDKKVKYLDNNKTLSDQIEKLQAEILQTNMAINAWKENCTEEIQERKRLKVENDTLIEQTSKLKEENDGLYGQTFKLKEKHTTLTEQTNELRKVKDSLTKQTSELENENCIIKQKLGNVEEELNTCKMTIETKKRTYEYMVQQNKFQEEKLNRYCEQLKEEKLKLEDDLNKCREIGIYYKSAYEDMVQKNQEIQKEKSELSKRLAEEWSNKVGANESDLENISIKCRPINIANDYTTFSSNEWLNVKDELDNKIEDATEEQKAQFLCDILMMCEDHCAKTYKEWTNNLLSSMWEPCKAVYSQRRKRRRHVGVGIETLQSVKVFKDNENHQNKETNEAVHHVLLEEKGYADAAELDNEKQQCCEVENDHVKKNYATSTVNEACSPGLGEQTDTEWKTDCTRQQTHSRDQEEEQMDTQDQNVPQFSCICKSEEESHEDVTNVPPTEHNNEISENADVQFTDSEMPLVEEWFEEEDILPLVVAELDIEPLPDKLTVLIGDHLRIHSDDINFESIVQYIMDTLSTNLIWDKKIVEFDHLKSYINTCVRLTWNMAIQRPPMRFQMTGLNERWNEVTQEPVYGGDNPNNPASRVKFYQLPTLMHGAKVMAKGKVLTLFSSMNE